ncbi:hypothetical protein P1X14_13530 [Sphingomonas sp. AOB5]|uniref:hypothetical protein n=1 Tax=Sphingomonas sp. AOB5 TaxID=3034017 RepID=UPI0023F76CD2|nr:hypothetical protein [Sphingomonas sp. AOB5]MDF7776272.1 hypothetical protein [Sphingomonas sp. AOB5]
MRRSLTLLPWLLVSCGPAPLPSAAECRALAEPKAVIDRCFGGDVKPGNYVGDLKCWPFSAPERMSGVWQTGFEVSDFFPGASKLPDDKDYEINIWLTAAPGTPELASGKYRGEFIGRRALCDGTFGHLGAYPRQVIVERMLSMTKLPASGL